MSKRFGELEFRDDFMFGIIMRNPKYCRPFLETILNIRISHIEYPKSQETIDLFGKGRHVYTFENRCVQDAELSLGDGAAKIVLNTKGNMNDVTPEMKRLLNFIDGQAPEDSFTEELAEAVKSVRNNEKWRLDYMTLQMSYQEKFEQGMEQEKIETAKRLIRLGTI